MDSLWVASYALETSQSAFPIWIPSLTSPLLQSDASMGTLDLGGGLTLSLPPLGGPSLSKALDGVHYKREACKIKWLCIDFSLVLLVVTKHSYTLPMLVST
jgi:hypothetical protein